VYEKNLNRQPTNSFPDVALRRIILIGLILLVTGFVLLMALIATLVRFAVGGSGNPPLPHPLAEIVGSFITFSTLGWIVFVILGAVLIIAGSVAKEKK
jgi:amino acid transporter